MRNILFSKSCGRLPGILFILLSIFVSVKMSEANIVGTVGTRFTLTGSGLGTAKPDVYIEYEKRPGRVNKVHAKVETRTNSSVTCRWTRAISPGTYDMWVKTGKGASPVVAETFTVAAPVVDSVMPDTLSIAAEITLTGRFFTSKKPAVYIKDPVTLKRKNCRVLNSEMDPETGSSSLTCVMPKLGSGSYEVTLQTPVGNTSFTVPASPSGPSEPSEPSKGLDNWNLRDSGADSALQSVAYGNGTFVAVGSKYLGRGLGAPIFESIILTSQDGVKWVKKYSETGGGYFTAVAYADGKFVALKGDAIFTSYDGMSWTTVYSSPGNVNLYGVTYGNGIFVAVGAGNYYSQGRIGVVLTSSDGVSWTQRYAETTDNGVFDVAYGNGIFTVIGSNLALISQDGVDWTRSGFGFRADPRSVVFGDGGFVAVGHYVILTSIDGVVWTPRYSEATNNDLWAVTYGAGIFTAVGSGPDSVDGGRGVILTSSDGVTWVRKNSGEVDTLLGVTYGNGAFVAAGVNGTIIQSDLVE